MVGVKLKQTTLLLFGALLAVATMGVSVAATPEINPVANDYGMAAPFLLSWVTIWIFALAGGLGSLFFKIPAIDANFRYLLIAKPFLGLFGAMSLCLVMTAGKEPPEGVLAAYAFIAALASAPILQGVLAVASVPRNQVEMLNAINPFKFKIVTADSPNKDKENTP